MVFLVEAMVNSLFGDVRKQLGLKVLAVEKIEIELLLKVLLDIEVQDVKRTLAVKNMSQQTIQSELCYLMKGKKKISPLAKTVISTSFYLSH